MQLVRQVAALSATVKCKVFHNAHTLPAIKDDNSAIPTSFDKFFTYCRLLPELCVVHTNSLAGFNQPEVIQWRTCDESHRSGYSEELGHLKPTNLMNTQKIRIHMQMKAMLIANHSWMLNRSACCQTIRPAIPYSLVYLVYATDLTVHTAMRKMLMIATTTNELNSGVAKNMLISKCIRTSVVCCILKRFQGCLVADDSFSDKENVSSSSCREFDGGSNIQAGVGSGFGHVVGTATVWTLG